MMQEIMARGTIGIGLDVGDDFSFYPGGIYNVNSQEALLIILKLFSMYMAISLGTQSDS